MNSRNFDYSNLMLLMIDMRRNLCHCSDAFELSSAQSVLLMILSADKGKSMNYLSSKMGCDASNITGLVDRLESRGFIKRFADLKDKRIKLISLTKSGIDQKNKLIDEINKTTALNMEKLSQNEKATFDQIIGKLTA